MILSSILSNTIQPLSSKKKFNTTNKGLLVKLACILLQGIYCEEDEDPYILCYNALINSFKFDEILDLKSDEALRNALNISFEPKIYSQMNSPYLNFWDKSEFKILKDKILEFLKELLLIIFQLRKFFENNLDGYLDYGLTNSMENSEELFNIRRDEIFGIGNIYEESVLTGKWRKYSGYSQILELQKLISSSDEEDCYTIFSNFYSCHKDANKLVEKEKIKIAFNRMVSSSNNLERAIEEELRIELKNSIETKLVMKEISKEVIKTIEGYYNDNISTFQDCSITIERIEKDLEQLSVTLTSKILVRMQNEQLVGKCLVKQALNEFLVAVNEVFCFLIDKSFTMENILKIDYVLKTSAGVIFVNLDCLKFKLVEISEMIEISLAYLSKKMNVFITTDEISTAILKKMNDSVLNNYIEEIIKPLLSGILTEHFKADFEDILSNSETNSVAINKIQSLLENNLQKEIQSITIKKIVSFLQIMNKEVISVLKKEDSPLNEAIEISRNVLRRKKNLVIIKDKIQSMISQADKLMSKVEINYKIDDESERSDRTKEVATAPLSESTKFDELQKVKEQSETDFFDTDSCDDPSCECDD